MTKTDEPRVEITAGHAPFSIHPAQWIVFTPPGTRVVIDKEFHGRFTVGLKITEKIVIASAERLIAILHF